MNIKVKLINREGWEKIIETPGYAVKMTNLFGEERIEYNPAPKIFVPVMAKLRTGITLGDEALPSAPTDETITKLEFILTNQKDSNDLWIFKEYS